MVLLDGTDYFDYYGNERFSASLTRRIRRVNARISLHFTDERHFSIDNTVAYTLQRSDGPLRPNPSIDDGHLQAGGVRFLWGDQEILPGVTGQRRVEVQIEHSNPRLFDTDFDYTRYRIQVDWMANTFLQRRFLPNALYLRLSAGTYSGSLPRQRFGQIDAAYAFYTPFGVLKTLNGYPYQGDQYLSFFWEHNFRTVPFEILGLRRLSRRGHSILIFGGHGRTWVSKQNRKSLPISPNITERFHHEIGASLSGLFSLFRIDFTWRLDAPGFSVGIGMARMF